MPGLALPDELSETEARYRVLTESSFDLISETDERGVYTYASPNHWEVLGYEEGELLGRSLFERLHPDDRRRVEADFAATLSRPQLGQVEFRYLHKNSEWRWFESTGQALARQELRSAGSSGASTCTSQRVVLISRDITQRKKHERQLATLFAIARTINAQNDLHAIATQLAALLKPLLPFSWLGISLLEGETLRLVATGGQGAARLDSYLSRGAHAWHPIWASLRESRVWVVNNWDYRRYAPASLTRAFINVPLSVDGCTIGVLHFDSLLANVFTGEHEQLARMVGEQVAVAVRSARLLELSRASEAKFRHLINDVDAIVWEAQAPDFAFSFVSPQAERWLGYPQRQGLEAPDFWTRHIHPEDREVVVRTFHERVRRGENHRLEFRMVTRDGRTMWFENSVRVEVLDGQPVRARGVMFDVTELKGALSSLRQSNAVLRATQEAAIDGICLINAQGEVESYNHRFVEMWQVPPALFLEGQREGIVPHVLAQLEEPGEFAGMMRGHEGVPADVPAASSRDEVVLRDGRVFERYSAPALSPQGECYGRVWSFSDITERKQFERQLAHQAFHDTLTSLPNRALFMNRLERAVARIGRGNHAIAVMFLDLDRFKVINDTLGHEVGDLLLVEVAHRLAGCVRPGDTVARFGGDEFTILLEDVAGVEDATQVAQRIADRLRTPIQLNGQPMPVTTSIGIVIADGSDATPSAQTNPTEGSPTEGDSLPPADTARESEDTAGESEDAAGEDAASEAGEEGASSERGQAADLLRHADVAMYRAKHGGGARYEVFDQKMSAQMLERLRLELDLHHAVGRGQLRLHYQPMVDLNSGEIVGTEALIRWQHPERGLIAPDDFISLAEETGAIVSIGLWVLDEACRQAGRWRVQFPNKPLSMSVNLSVRQLEEQELVEDVARTLASTGMAPGTLKLEITESAVVTDIQGTTEQLKRLKGLGVQLAVDDFGVGYSSLSYLEQFPLDVLKIDRSFVSQMGLNGNTAILQAVHTLGQELSIQVTAEGIENLAQVEKLRALQCQVGQGYYYSKPLPADQMETLLQRTPVW